MTANINRDLDVEGIFAGIGSNETIENEPKVLLHLGFSIVKLAQQKRKLFFFI